MKYVLPNKERGVVMILILVFLTMFAMMIAAFLFMTSSMSDSAANALALQQKGETTAARSDTDIDTAIRTLLIGTNNEASPIGPFGILENLYGDQTTLEGYDFFAAHTFNLYGEYDGAVPTRAILEINIDDQADNFLTKFLDVYAGRIDYLQKNPSGNDERDRVLLDRLLMAHAELEGLETADLRALIGNRFLESGSTISFGSLQWVDHPGYDGDVYVQTYLRKCRDFNEYLSGTSARIIKKSFNATGEFLTVEIALSEELKKFLTVWPSDASTGAWPINDIAANFALTANIRFNPLPFGGTGAGGFAPDSSLDGQMTSATAGTAFFPDEDADGESAAPPIRLPFALWANAAAPDITPYVDLDGNTDFQTYWRHLADNEFRVYTPRSKEAIFPNFTNTWNHAADAKVTPHHPIRMNPGHTAVDERNLFLGGLSVGSDEKTTVTPSFLRPKILTALKTLLDASHGESQAPASPALLRKVVPRPLRIDHWNWSGGNDNLLANPYGRMTDDPETFKTMVLEELDALIAGSGENLWDVDNDNDGIRDGIWIPSGLPIRVDENGTPYATMFSFTVLDLDGRVNVNTAGNWDQLPHWHVDCYSELAILAAAETTSDTYSPWHPSNSSSPCPLPAETASDPNSPWYSFESLTAGIGWYNDADDDITDTATDFKSGRGTGRGPAGIELTAAFQAMEFLPWPSLSAQRILATRYRSSEFGVLNATKTVPEDTDPALFDGLERNWTHVLQRGQLSQPSAYYAEPNTPARTDPGQWVSNNSDDHRRFYLYTDAVYRGDKNGVLADPNLFLFPWRGKTRIFDYGTAPGSVHYPKKYSLYPTFDFCDTAFRSYDPLGGDLFTYMPRYSENPYLVNPFGSTHADATFTAEMLETLLRPFDYDRKSLNPELPRALLLGASTISEQLEHPERERYRSLRQEITTVSSDIPVPASALQVGTAEVRDGVYGIRELLRRAVLLEIYKANRESTFDGDYVNRKKQQFVNDLGIPLESNEGKERFRTYLRGQVENDISDYKNKALDKITDQLFALLPQDIREGRRLDLNALSRKACWIDSVYEDQGDGTYVRTLPTGDVTPADKEEFEYYHLRGLVERMKFARGLYLLLMTLTYEERNAATVGYFYDGDPDSVLAQDKYKDYLEGCDKGFIDSIKAGSESDSTSETVDEKKARLAEELIASRIAQYCINLVDFSDPDATITPFFYDPNPFDGWWSYRDTEADWIHGDFFAGDETTPPRGNDNLSFVLHTPMTDANDPELDFYEALIPARGEDGSYSRSFFSTPDATVTEHSRGYVNDSLPVSFIDATVSYSQALVAWLNGQSLTHPGIGQDDFGFRIVWGMERPDLLLTETLNFHDLGIADTSVDPTGKTVYNGEDDDFDQVRRPLGSTYLELYCAANPNIPQSPELYRYDQDRELWKLQLSKMTPRQKSDSPYPGLEFPIWRVAITASVDPRGNEEKEKEFTDTFPSGEENLTVSYKRTIRKTKNSAVERLLGEKADPRTFSFRTRQFCDLTISSSGEKSLDTKLDSRWRGYDYSVASILGPCGEPASDGSVNLVDEVEIDRIVWFGWPTKPGGSTFDVINNFPDASHIFSRVKETQGDELTTSIFPNQYLVVAPAEKRPIGSAYKNETYFGIPSSHKIVMTNLRASNSGKWTNSDYILAGSYYGLDINSDDKFEVNKRGLNISEPLWTEVTDPYPDTIPTKDITYENETITVTDNDRRNTVPDAPFDLPASDRRNDRYPIAADHLFGLGTMPGIRTAFVQRVADPNRPYHPFANPYLSVDWNMMDLTVFNGEANGSGDSQTDDPFYTAEDANENEIDQENHILVSNSVFCSDDNTAIEFDTDTVNTESIFSSRSWLDPEQKGFLPEGLSKEHRPNPWARSLDKEGLQNETAGLRKVKSIGNMYDDLTDLYAGLPNNDTQENVVKIFPRHTLGAYNHSENRVTELESQFEGARNAEYLRKLYYGAPARSGSNELFHPFEYLAWNDAPMSSPAELLLVPASTPGRFGLEFIRNVKDAEDGDGLTLATLCTDGKEDADYGRLGRSLGSGDGSDRNLYGWKISDVFTGPYLNFHHTSKVKGESLNLATLFDFVTIPSLYMGTQIFSGYDENDDPIYTPTLREPGKINLNTMKGSGWAGILGKASDHRATYDYRTKYEDFDKTRKTTFRPGLSASLRPELAVKADSDESDGEALTRAPGDVTLLRADSGKPLLDQNKKRNNMVSATEELRKLAGITTNRSNVFAVWITVGYFEVQRARPGVNMPLLDPDGNSLQGNDPTTGLPLVNADGFLSMPVGYKYYGYYNAIYPDGYTYGKELGSGGIDTEGVNRPRAFYLIDRSIPVDFRRGRSWNWDNTILLQRKL
ncbi:MAG: hypothetical protein ACOX6D_04020 [Thermoguttaceae bacterium]